MKALNHPNILNLIGVSIDAGESPYIIMPYMVNGSLLAYLRKKRADLTIAEGVCTELVSFINMMCLAIIIRRAEKRSGLTHKIQFTPPKLEYALIEYYVSGATQNVRFSHFWSYAHRVCIFFTSLLCNSYDFQYLIDFGLHHYVSKPFY